MKTPVDDFSSIFFSILRLSDHTLNFPDELFYLISNRFLTLFRLAKNIQSHSNLFAQISVIRIIRSLFVGLLMWNIFSDSRDSL